ncbi:MAG: hypothetical protein ACKOWN_07175 [Microbacteriaceae bacterium]
MNRFQKAIAVVAAASVIGFGGFVSTSANAATNDEIANYLTSAVATQLGLTDSTTLHTIVVEAMNNGLLQASVTDAAAAAVDGTSSLTADELAALLDANLTQQLSTLEQQLIDLGVLPDPNVPVDPPVDPGTVTDDDSDDVEDAEDADRDVDDDDLPGAVDHHGGRNDAHDDSFTVDPQGDGLGHTSHGNGRGVGHDHHEGESDND